MKLPAELIIRWRGNELRMDRLSRGGVVIQVGVDRGGTQLEWNYIELPKRFAVYVQKYLALKLQRKS